MYRPRRTSEFHEDPREDGGVLGKRQARSRSTTSAHKPSQLLHPNWQAQSRISQDRDRGTPLRTGGPPPTTNRTLASGSTAGITPMRAVVLHTDKKWVQEQSQLIAEYLDEMVNIHVLQGFSSEFFSRGASSLRQMTMKQFVSIVNFFLQFIWRNRISVGTNHVEDIQSALHKLNYPYQVNKSWLMTPTTQHSFGHVIVMLDFLRDFAPPSPAKKKRAGQFEEFPFMEANEQPSYVQNTLDATALSNTQASSVLLNEEAIQLLFNITAECFAVWDKHKWDEYEVLKREVSDQFIKCLCDLPDTAALDADIARQQKELQQLEEQLQLTANNNLEQLEQLKAQDQHLKQELLTTLNQTKQHGEQIDQLDGRSVANAKKIKVTRKELRHLQRRVDGQKCSAEMFQRMKVMLSDLENEDQFYKRQMHEFSERGYNQQVKLSRAKKHLLDLVEKFNTHAQNIGLDSDICSASEKDKLELVLPLPSQHSDVLARSRRLAKLAALLAQRGAQLAERQRQLEQHSTELTLQSKNLEASLKLLDTHIQSTGQQMEQLHHSYKTKSSKWTQHLQHLDARKFELNAKLEQLRQEQHKLTELLENKRQKNEEYLSAAERRQEELLRAREAFLQQYQQQLVQAEEQIKQFHATVDQNDAELANLKRQLENTELPSFEDELNALFREMPKSYKSINI